MKPLHTHRVPPRAKHRGRLIKCRSKGFGQTCIYCNFFVQTSVELYLHSDKRVYERSKGKAQITQIRMLINLWKSPTIHPTIKLLLFSFNFSQVLTVMSVALNLKSKIICKPWEKLHTIFHSKSLKQNILLVARIGKLWNYPAMIKPFSIHFFQDMQNT